MHCSVPRAGGLKEGQREQVLSGLASFDVMHITALFLEKSLGDFSTGTARHFVTVVFLYRCFLFYFNICSPFLYNFPLPVFFHIAFYCLLFCPKPLSLLFFPLQRHFLPVCLSGGEHSEYVCPYSSYGFPAFKATPLWHLCNGARKSLSLQLNEKGFTQLSTDCERSPSIIVSKGNKMAAC